MADVTIDASVLGSTNTCQRWCPVWTSASTLYSFYIDSSAEAVYQKSTDRGATWGGVVVISSISTVARFSVWFDKWTKGDTGTKVHVVYGNTGGDVLYRSLDTAGDTLSTETTPHSTAGGSATSVSITKAVGSRLEISWSSLSATMNSGFVTSSDGGATWDSKASPWDSPTTLDDLKLVPGNEADTNDIYAIYRDDTSEDFELKTYDDSGDSWSTVSIATSFDVSAPSYEAAQRHSDGHIVLVAADDGFGAVHDVRIWDIANGTTITEKAVIFDDESDNHGVALMIDQLREDIYVAVSQGAAGPNRDVVYRVSRDGGATWESLVTYSEASTYDIFRVDAPLSIGADLGSFIVSWVDDATDDLLINAVNAVPIIKPGSVIAASLEIDGYEPFFGGSAINVKLELNIREWKQVHRTGGILLNVTGGQNQALALDTAELIITVNGTAKRLHEAHPTTGVLHGADAVDIEEAALLWNRLTPRKRARLRHVLISGDRLYEGVIRQLILVDNPGTELVDFILTFEVAWNKSRPTLREWN